MSDKTTAELLAVELLAAQKGNLAEIARLRTALETAEARLVEAHEAWRVRERKDMEEWKAIRAELEEARAKLAHAIEMNGRHANASLKWMEQCKAAEAKLAEAERDRDTEAAAHGRLADEHEPCAQEKAELNISRHDALRRAAAAESREKALREALKQADRTLEVASDVGEIRFKTCVLSAQVHDQIVAAREANRAALAAGKEPELRPEVAAFAQAMERKLREHDKARGRRGWRHATGPWLMLRLLEEAGELARAVRLGARGPMLVDEAADVGNLAMMVADAAGALAAGKEGT